jgi:2-polyprenyl-6-methoxyphenol hydroxylase-like FAD-dependent oxidoreductase
MIKPVLIIGAGPVGMTLASELARYGVAVRIIDKAAQRTDKSKALVLWSRTLELLDRGGGAAPFIEAGFKAHAINFVAGDKTIGHFTMDSVPSAYSYALMLPQSETERLLEERLNRFGVAIERQVEAISFRQTDAGVETVLKHADGREEKASAPWLVGCDGAHSLARHGVGATFAGESLDSDWILADVHMRGYPYPDSEMSVHWHHEGVFVIFPISPGRYRIIADLPASGAEHSPVPTLEEVQAMIDRRGPPGLAAFDPIWLSGFRINGRKVSHYRWGRVFLAGDAAHVHSPAGGQGMNTGMQDAFNLAWKLALVVHGTCGEHLLDSYSPERSKVGDMVLHNAERLTAIGTMKNPVAQTLRNLAAHVMLGLSPVQHALAAGMSEVTIGYPDSPLNGLSFATGPKPGARVAPIPGQAPVGSGDKPLFALFAAKTATSEKLAKSFAGLLDPEIRPPFDDGGMWLVRPDGYAACSSADATIIAAYLEGLKRPGAN